MNTKRTIKKEIQPWAIYYSNSYKFWTVVHTDEGGYTEDGLEIDVRADKTAISLHDDDGFLYLNPDQINYLVEILKKHGFIKE